MSKLLSTLLIASIASSSNAQLQKSDTVLYLWFESGYNYKHISAWILREGKKKQQIDVYYSLTSIPGIYDGYPLDFKSTRRVPSDTVKLKTLEGNVIVTVKQLSSFIQNNYPKDVVGFRGKSYLDKLRHIYVVEHSLCKGFVTITPVGVDVQIED